MADAYS